MNARIANIDEDRIRDAIRQAEGRTAGEIVPVVVPRSDRYEVATWRAVALGVLVSLAGVLLVVQFYTGWGLGWLFTPWGVTLVALGGGMGSGLLAAFVPSLRRLAIGEDLLDETVHRRALQAFLEEEVFDTRHRTGILLFVSLFEHRVEVLGDTGINRQVDSEDWAEVVERVRRGIRNGNLTDGLVDAIALSGQLLERRGVDIRPDDENELSNAVRMPNTPWHDTDAGPSPEE